MSHQSNHFLPTLYNVLSDSTATQIHSITFFLGDQITLWDQERRGKTCRDKDHFGKVMSNLEMTVGVDTNIPRFLLFYPQLFSAQMSPNWNWTLTSWLQNRCRYCKVAVSFHRGIPMMLLRKCITSIKILSDSSIIDFSWPKTIQNSK